MQLHAKCCLSILSRWFIYVLNLPYQSKTILQHLQRLTQFTLLHQFLKSLFSFFSRKSCLRSNYQFICRINSWKRLKRVFSYHTHLLSFSVSHTSAHTLSFSRLCRRLLLSLHNQIKSALLQFCLNPAIFFPPGAKCR